MATGRSDAGKLLIITLLCVYYGYPASALNMPNIDHVVKWAQDLSTMIRTNMSSFTGLTLLDPAYNNLNESHYTRDKVKLKFERVNATILNEKMAEDLHRMLSRKMEALNRSVEVAENAAANYTWDAKIRKDDVFYFASKELEESTLEFNERFKQKVLTNVSSVHIPVEIYDGDVEILNGLKWSAALDKVFAENFKRDPEILWQYFGSQSGFMRTLPASKWKIGPQEVDLYDVRRRPWFTQGSSSPKDMLILIDTSGSVHGQALELIKVSVRSLLDTLGENDFVNIAKFDKKATFVSCFNETLVQANYRNKKILMDAVEKIAAQGMADFGAGLTFAFEQFIKLDNETTQSRGAGCNRMIMLLTDGGTDLAEEVFKEYNPEKNQTVRVFTYAVGPTANPATAIKWMACANRGFFSQIPAMGAIRSKVQEYLRKGTTAMETYNVPYVERRQWSLSMDPRGLGMMTTVTLPVYNRTIGKSNQTILGVMGIDVTTKEMLDYEPKRTLGANGYAFAINSNGYIVFHPNLRIQPGQTDPPNVDFLEVEYENDDKEKIRRQMIGQETSTVTVETYLITRDKRHVSLENRTYAYRGIPDTSFSLGISLPSYQNYHMKVETDLQYFNMSILRPQHTALLIADWEYYENFSSEANLTGTIDDLDAALHNYQNFNWNSDEINHLLFDINVTQRLDTYLYDIGRLSPKGQLVGSFVATNGGLTRVFPNSEDMVARFSEERNAWSADYFQRAVGSSLYLFNAPYILTPDTSENATASEITVVKSVTLRDGNPAVVSNYSGVKYDAAVVGAILTHETVQNWLFNTRQTVPTFGGCNNTDEFSCYLLDDGAFLIATNQDQLKANVGRFFGHLDAEVMWELYNKTHTYHRLENYDYQAICKIEDSNSSSAGTLNFKIPSVNFLFDILTFDWWSTAVTALINLNLYNLIFNPSVQTVAASPEVDRPCIKTEAQYYFESSFKYHENLTDCTLNGCERKYSAARVGGTNLLLLVTQKMREGCEKCADFLSREDDLMQEPTESFPDFCNVEPRYRLADDVCYDHDPREDPTKCGCMSCHSVSIWITCLMVLVSVCQWCL